MIKLSRAQQEAADKFHAFVLDDDQDYLVISGFAGSGKSFLVRHLNWLLQQEMQLIRAIDPEYRGYRTLFTATTNKAAEVLSRLVGEPVTTIHSLLRLRVVNNYQTGKQTIEPARNQMRPITNYSMIFIDEASMIDRKLLHEIEEHQKRSMNCKIVYIGDPYQLPPVMEDPCKIFKATGKHHAFLDEIQRQVEGSPIIQLSAQYRNVLDHPDTPWPKITPDHKSIFYYDDRDAFEKQIKRTVTAPDFDPISTKVLAWSNNRVRAYNRQIRKLNNRQDDFEPGETVMTNKPLMKDKVILAPTDSLHRITRVSDVTVAGIEGWHIELNSQGAHAFFQPKNWNKVNQLLKRLAKDKNWKAYFGIKEEWVDLRPIYSLTCHKAQGSTYREVFVDLNDIGRNTRWKEVARLAYVAVTRASDVLHVYGTIDTNYSTKMPNNMGAFDEQILDLLN